MNVALRNWSSAAALLSASLILVAGCSAANPSASLELSPVKPSLLLFYTEH